MNIITTKKGIKNFGITFLIFGVLSTPMALIAIISGAYNLKNSFDIFMDILMRIVFVGIPISFLVSAVGLLRYKKWGRLCAIIFSIILSIMFLIYGILSITSSEAKYYISSVVTFSVISFIFVLFFATTALYLIKAKEQFDYDFLSVPFSK